MAIKRFDEIASTLLGYWNPNEAGTLTTSGNVVESLAPAYPDTAPTLVTSRVTNPAPIYFDGTTKIGELPAIYTDTSPTNCGLDADWALGQAPHTVVMVYQKYQDTNQDNATMFQFYMGDLNTQARGSENNSGTEAFIGAGGGHVRGPSLSTLPGVIAYGFDTSTAQCQIWRDGDRTEDDRSLGTDSRDVAGIAFMGRRNGNNYSLLGKMAIMCVYAGILSDAEISEVTELANNWMLDGAPPAPPAPNTHFGPVLTSDPTATLTFQVATLPGEGALDWYDIDDESQGLIARGISYELETVDAGGMGSQPDNKLNITSAVAAQTVNIQCVATTAYDSIVSNTQSLAVQEA